MRYGTIAMTAALTLTACGDQSAPARNDAAIQVRSAEQDQLHKLDALNLAIALKRAIYDAKLVCRRVTDAGFIGKFENLDMWMARCDDGKDWAVFAGPDGTAQVRDCKDLPGTGVPECSIKQRPSGSFDGAEQPKS